jgi:hypothetical protein
MESISQLVESSLARHGVPANFDHLRLQWTSWFRCESSFSVLLAPAKPGIFALGEEIIPPAPADLAATEGKITKAMGLRASSPAELIDGHNRPAGKRMLGLFQISPADDLGMALGRLFLPGNPLRERLTTGRCFARYAMVEDPDQRRIATEVFQRWMQESSETASGIGQQDRCGAGALARESINKPSTSFAWGMEVQEREVEKLKRQQPLPSGF